MNQNGLTNTKDNGFKEIGHTNKWVIHDYKKVSELLKALRFKCF